MAAPELYAPRRPDAGRARTGRQQQADTSRRRGLVYRALTTGVAIAIVGGFGYYAWSAYSGDRAAVAPGAEVAVIEAPADPLKTPPENPGGIAVTGSDYEFFASVDGGLEVRPDEEFVLPPPEAPITEPSPEIFDRPPPVPLELAGGGAAANATAPEPAVDVAEIAPTPVALAGVVVPPVLANPMLPLPAVEQGTFSAPQPVEASAAAEPAMGAQSAIDALVASMADEHATTYVVAAEPVAAASQPAAATTAPTGGATVQLASMLSQELAEAEWSRLRRLLPDLLANREPIIRASTSNDRTYYRVSIAAADRVEAAALCAEIKNRSLDCIVHN